MNAATRVNAQAPSPNDPPIKGRYDWETPHWLFEDLDREFAFEVDAASSAANAKCDRFWTKNDCGLSRSWEGLRVWCNPPYGLQTARWVKKARDETVSGSCPVAVLLVPANTETFWWHDYAMAHCAEIRFIRRRIHFLLGGRSVPNSRPVFSSAVLVFLDGNREGRGVLATTLYAPDPKTLEDGRRNEHPIRRMAGGVA